MSQNILITGGLGFIGSHTAVELGIAGHNVTIVDNLKNSKENVYQKIYELSSCANIKFYKVDLKNYDDLEDIFKTNNQIDVVIHFAGLKSVNESVQNPILYYEDNIVMTLNLVKCMKKYNCFNIIFSSSATVYGNPTSLPLTENSQVGINLTNPYGKTKFFQEEILKDLYNSDNRWTIILLRYFNPVGAHPSGKLGENPNDIPNNLMPYLLDVAIGTRPILNIFGGDWKTFDGTCIRDFIHVVDLAKGHLFALKKMNTRAVHIYNLGSGTGTSVKEIIDIFQNVNNLKINTQIIEKREGDVCAIFTSSEKAFTELGWKTELTIEDACRDSWNYIFNLHNLSP